MATKKLSVIYFVSGRSSSRGNVGSDVIAYSVKEAAAWVDQFRRDGLDLTEVKPYATTN